MMCYTTTPNRTCVQAGFSLIELAIGLVIIGLIAGSLITPLSSLRELNARKDSQQMLNDLHDALIGYAVNHSGQLPCPATASSNGQAAVLLGACTQEHGFVPAVSLGIQGAYDSNNRLLDPWGQPYRYSLSATSAFRICLAADCPVAASIIAANIPAVLLSTGADGGQTTASVDQLDNTDNDNQFVNQTPRQGSNAFDDQLRWISAHTLTYFLSR